MMLDHTVTFGQCSPGSEATLSISAISEPAIDSLENDDIIGFKNTDHGFYAWVIDGGTSVAAHNCLGATCGDVRWYVEALSQAIKSRATQGASPRAVHELAVKDVAPDYFRLRDLRGDATPLFAQPIAAVTIVHLTFDAAVPHCEIYQLADCASFFVNDAGETVRMTALLGQQAEANISEKVRRAQASIQISPSEIFKSQLGWLRKRREEQLRTLPLEISTPSANSDFGGRDVSFDIRSVSTIVIMSDGMERYSTHYCRGDYIAMVNDIIAIGPKNLLLSIREIERADGNCRFFPRLKQSDDASCILIQIAHSALPAKTR